MVSIGPQNLGSAELGGINHPDSKNPDSQSEGYMMALEVLGDSGVQASVRNLLFEPSSFMDIVPQADIELKISDTVDLESMRIVSYGTTERPASIRQDVILAQQQGYLFFETKNTQYLFQIQDGYLTLISSTNPDASKIHGQQLILNSVSIGDGALLHYYNNAHVKEVAAATSPITRFVLLKDRVTLEYSSNSSGNDPNLSKNSTGNGNPPSSESAVTPPSESNNNPAETLLDTLSTPLKTAPHVHILTAHFKSQDLQGKKDILWHVGAGFDTQKATTAAAFTESPYHDAIMLASGAKLSDAPFVQALTFALTQAFDQDGQNETAADTNTLILKTVNALILDHKKVFDADTSGSLGVVKIEDDILNPKEKHLTIGTIGKTHCFILKAGTMEDQNTTLMTYLHEDNNRQHMIAQLKERLTLEQQRNVRNVGIIDELQGLIRNLEQSADQKQDSPSLRKGILATCRKWWQVLQLMNSPTAAVQTSQQLNVCHVMESTMTRDDLVLLLSPSAVDRIKKYPEFQKSGENQKSSLASINDEHAIYRFLARVYHERYVSQGKPAQDFCDWLVSLSSQNGSQRNPLDNTAVIGIEFKIPGNKKSEILK